MDDLLIKYLLDEATPEETTRVERWLGADEANLARLEQFRAVWGLGRRLAETSSSSVDHHSALRRFMQRRGQASEAGPANGARVRRMPVVRVAAAFIGVLVLGAGLYTLTRPARRAQPPIAAGKPATGGQFSAKTPGTGGRPSVETSHGLEKGHKWLAGLRPQTDTLPDRSTVTLNRGGSLALVGKLTDNAVTVRLEGEGFFSVRHEPSRAFVVEVHGAVVTVLGTSFELNGRNRDSIDLIVETGVVRVSGRNSESMIVRAGERAAMMKDGRWRKEFNQDRLYGYYLGRPLVCDAIPLRRLVEILNEAYDARIELGRSELGDLPLTTTFRGETLDKILKIVSATFDLSIVRAGPKIILQ